METKRPFIMNTSIIYKDESYLIIGKCFEVHNELGHGFLEVVYKDALEVVFKQDGISLKERRSMTSGSGTFYCHVSSMRTLWCWSG